MREKELHISRYLLEEDRALIEMAERVAIDDDYSLCYRYTGAFAAYLEENRKAGHDVLFKMICMIFRVGYLQGSQAAMAGKCKGLFSGKVESKKASSSNKRLGRF